MENNLEDVLIDNFEEKPQKKSSKRMILIIVASVVLLGVLSISFFILFKQKPNIKTLEINELEKKLEKLDIKVEDKQENKLDELIANIKKEDEQISAEIKESQETKSKNEKREEKKVEKIDEATKQPQKQTVEVIKNEQPKKQVEQSKASKQPKVADKPNKSASQLFQSMEKNISKGFYLQVGVFGEKPQKRFMDKLKKYSYKIDKIRRDEKILNRYLIGPFSDRKEAQNKIEEITQEIGKPIIVEIR